MRFQRLGMLAVLTWIAAWAASPATADYVSFFPYGDGSSSEGTPNHYGPPPVGYAQMTSMQSQMPDPGIGYSGPMGPESVEPMMQGAMEGYPGEGYGGDEYGFDESYGCDSCDEYGDGDYGFGKGDGGGMFGGHGAMNWLRAGLGQCGPYENGQCGPRWFDIHVEGLYWHRDTVSREVNFVSDGVAGNAPPFVVLSTRDLDFDEEPGFRVTLRFEVGSVSAIEVGYFAMYGFESQAEVTSDIDNLFSVFSDFGNPPFFPGFSDTDRASFASIRYRSDLQNAEINLRRQWISNGGRIHGSSLAGFRYLRLTESLRHITRTDNGNMDYYVGTENNLYGFQVGGDVWMCALPGLMFGGEVEAGIYGVDAKQNTKINAASLADPVLEDADSQDAALIAEGGPMFVWQLHPSCTIRAGYQVLYIDGVALAPENFNSRPPFINPGPPRTVKINDNGSALYHGATLGFEYIW